VINDYYEAFVTQNRVSVPDGFGGIRADLVDCVTFMGLYRQDMSGEQRRADASGITSKGIFVTDISTQIKERDVIKRKRDGLYLNITSMPVESTDAAKSSFKTMNAEKSED
jgi:hypothetical protein